MILFLHKSVKTNLLKKGRGMEHPLVCINLVGGVASGPLGHE